MLAKRINMCTVLYLPSNDKICFASLRDESPTRKSAIRPKLIDDLGVKFLAPLDPEGGGTWLGTNELGDVIILLNGGFVKHKHLPKYRKSRGLIVTELLSNKLPYQQWLKLDLDNIEPFTLVIYSESKLYCMVWDGKQKHEFEINTELPHIWSSATLYTEEAKHKRSNIFETWIATKPEINRETVFEFFSSTQDIENGFFMNRAEKVKTLSYSFVEYSFDGSVKLIYEDFVDEIWYSAQLDFNNKINI